jgi:probable rRNA maturation factor
MVNVEIQASSRYPITRRRIKQKINEVLESFDIYEASEVEINIIGDRKMRHLKKKHMGIDETTDVLSFPLHEGLVEGKRDREFISLDNVLRLGTIFVSYPQALRQASLHKLLVDEEIDQLIEHGMYHLLGIHHND